MILADAEGPDWPWPPLRITVVGVMGSTWLRTPAYSLLATMLRFYADKNLWLFVVECYTTHKSMLSSQSVDLRGNKQLLRLSQARAKNY